MHYILEFAGFEPSTADTRGYYDADFLTVRATWRVEVAS